MFANGQELGQARDDHLASRGGSVHLCWDMRGPAEDGAVEVRFTDFQVYSLVPKGPRKGACVLADT
jgi:hypothetical protein